MNAQDTIRIIMVVFIIVACSVGFYNAEISQEPKFHMMDKVLVTKGFYKGCSGTVVGYSKNTYDVELRCVKGDDVERPDAEFFESELAIVNVEIEK